MDDTIPMPLDPFARNARNLPAALDEARPDAAGHRLPVEFSGSGSEYFRIWIVNLLLTLVTLGLYYPWAKVRRLRYFYGNTSVGGHPLDFHGEPKRMLRGFLLVAALVGLYSLAGNVSPGAGLMAFLIVAAVWPALFRASQQFRLANTSWRGLRFRFTGDLAGAYRAMLPLFVPGVLLLGAAMLPFTLPAGDAIAGDAIRPNSAFVGFATLLTLLLFPLLLWLLKKYQHDHLALGQEQTQLRAGAGSFYLLGLKAVGVVLLGVLAIGLIATVFTAGGFAKMVFGGGNVGTAGVVGMIVMFALVFVAYIATVVALQPYVTSRLQNLVWSRTRSRHVRFDSTLRFWPLFRLTLKNWFLIVISLGLYLPFAKIAMARMRLQAVTVHMLLDPDLLVGQLRANADDASGDAAGDLFGIDIGL